MPFVEIDEIDREYWDDCPDCNIKPFVWEFDNGRYAKCNCMEEYKDRTYISATNVRECYNNEGVCIKDYVIPELRDNWNKHVKHLIRKKKIETFLKNS